MMCHSKLFAVVFLFVLSISPAVVFWSAQVPPKNKNPQIPTGPLSPKQEQKTLRIAPGLRIELVAAEPQVKDPVALQFGEDGRLWVVEMGDYPNGPPTGKPPRGRIRVLKDKDGDGYYETANTFADGLLFANGLLPWKDGVIVTQAPNIVHLRDTNGDGKADRRDIWYEGFAAKNPQLRVSHPKLGVDGWIYVANGLRGGYALKAGAPNSKAIDLRSKDFRFHPIRGVGEAISGMGQFGNCFDDWGRRFVCDNRHHLRHVVLADRYLKRNRDLAVRELLNDISILEGGMLNSGGKIYPLSKNWTTSNLHAGRFTAACGVYIYRSELLPKEYYGNAFTCDPTGNLVHREVLKPHGGSFRSKPARKGVEFLASPHDWFRPVFLTEGPDGALYLADMYRAVIEHPQFMPPELKKRPDLYTGHDKGRIWRIVPEKYQGKPIRPQLNKTGSADLVKMLSRERLWERVTAQRLLLQRQDNSVRPDLLKLCLSDSDPRGRILAAWLLKNAACLNEHTLGTLLQDRHPRVRENAVRIAERAFFVRLQKQLLRLARDPDGHVRFQVALSLGRWVDDRVLPPLAEIALTGADDRWTRTAVASALSKRSGKLLSLLLSPTYGLTTKQSPGRKELLHEFCALVGRGSRSDEVIQVLKSLNGLKQNDAHAWQLIGLHGVAQGIRRSGKGLGEILRTQLEFTKTSKVGPQTMKLIANAAVVAKDEKQDESMRLKAIELLAELPWDQARSALLPLLQQGTATQFRLAAVRSIAKHRDKEANALLLQSWSKYTPPLRDAVASALLQNAAGVRAVLQSLKDKRIRPADLDAVHTRRLLNFPVAGLRAEFRKLLAASIPAARKKVLALYQGSLKLAGNEKMGRNIFEKNCAKCHRIANMGEDVGPVISDTRTKTKAALLYDILNPNQAIDNNFVNYTVVTKGGKVVTGLIATETASSITLKRAKGETDVVLRRDIASISSSGVSLMPEGLEKDISVRDMAHLLAFLKNWRYADGNVPAGK